MGLCPPRKPNSSLLRRPTPVSSRRSSSIGRSIPPTPTPCRRELRDAIRIGQRVEAPFGKGDRATIGYCVGFTESAPPRAVKAIVRILDAEPLLDRAAASAHALDGGILSVRLGPGAASHLARRRALACRAQAPHVRPSRQDSARSAAAALAPNRRPSLSYLRQSGDLIDPEEIMRTIPCGNAVIEARRRQGTRRSNNSSPSSPKASRTTTNPQPAIRHPQSS